MTAVGVLMMVVAGITLMGGMAVYAFAEGGTLVGAYVVALDVLLVGFVIACVGTLD